MMRFTPAIGARILFGLSLMTIVHGFVMKTQFGRPVHNRGALHMSTDASLLPSLEQLSKDPFMKQVQYGAQLVPLFDSENPIDLKEKLVAQLSHSDGVRGFMVSYLTVDGQSPADMEQVPLPLREAMAEANMEDLVPLACMNVIMPTAMMTMHQDPDLQAQSALTGSRGARLLEVLGHLSPEVDPNCKAIFAVASGDTDSSAGVDTKLLKFWTEFFDKWGYKEQQKADIASIMQVVLGGREE